MLFLFFNLPVVNFSSDDLEIVKSNGAVVQEGSNVLDAPCEPSSLSSITLDNQNVDESGIDDAQSYCTDIIQVTSQKGIPLVHKINTF